MAPNRGQNRAKDFESLVDNGVKEFDPEEDYTQNDDDAYDSSEAALNDSGDEWDGREHYVDVEKSKLRKPKNVALGPQYRGSRVTRQAIDDQDDDDDDDENDPFNHGFDEESSDSGELDSGEDESDLVQESEDAEAGTSDTELTDDELDGPPIGNNKPGESVKEQLRKTLDSETEKSVAASMSQANREDAEKGRAIKRQRTAFDSLLQVRMKLQKSLIATNTLVGETNAPVEIDRTEAQILDAAETAAFNLWNSLTRLREDLSAARTGQKRKHVSCTPETSVNELLSYTHGQETDSRSIRDSVLRKWSKKAQGPEVVPERGRLNQTESRATIIDVLQEQLSNSERLVKHTHAPRSCAPLQLSKRVTEDQNIYDDADFYSLLLKELLEQKSQDSVAASNIDLGLQMRREAKTKRNVDTKASKGRKLRYTVHEKLQNFMAPEDRSSWGERQAGDLFGSLFGQQLGLGEEVHELNQDVDMDEVFDSEEAGLMMFRS